MRTKRVSIDLAEIAFVTIVLVLGIVGKVDWWIVGLFILSKFELKFAWSF